MSGLHLYRLQFRNAYNGTPDAPRPLFYRRRSPDKRYGYERHYIVEAGNACYPPTEWKTLDGIRKFVAAHPTLAEKFDIVEIIANCEQSEQ